MGFKLSINRPYIIDGKYGKIIEDNGNTMIFSTPGGSTTEIKKIIENSEDAIKLDQFEKNAKRLGMLYGKPYKEIERGHTGAGAKKSKKDKN